MLTELLSFPEWLINALTGILLIAIASTFGAFENVSLHPVTKRSFRCKGTVSRLRKGFMIATLVTGILVFSHGVLARAGLLDDYLRLFEQLIN